MKGSIISQVRHESATTTHAIRTAIQRWQASLATLSRELGINPKTVAKWRKRETVEDPKTGPKEPRSTVLTEAEEAMIDAFRRHTLLPLDDCPYALQPTIPHLTRLALHRCLQRHGISRLPDVEGDKRQRFKRYPIGIRPTHSDRWRSGPHFTSTSPSFRLLKSSSISSWLSTAPASSRSRNSSTRPTGAQLGSFWNACSKPCPTRFTRSSPSRQRGASVRARWRRIRFAEQPRNRNTARSRQMRFDMICEAHGIEHRLTKLNHPWSLEDHTNG